MPSLTALVGAATAVSSAALIAWPRMFLGPAGLADTPASRALLRGFAARDIGIGVAMTRAPAGPGRRLATAARVLSDWTDVAVLPPATPDRPARIRVIALAAGWGALSLAALVLDERAGR